MYVRMYTCMYMYIYMYLYIYVQMYTCVTFEHVLNPILFTYTEYTFVELEVTDQCN